MSGKKDGFAALADITNQVPDGAARLWVQPGGQLVEKTTSGSLISARAMNNRCF